MPPTSPVEKQRHLLRSSTAVEWVDFLKSDVEGFYHESWLETRPWADVDQDPTRLVRLNSDDMDKWLPVWSEFGKSCSHTVLTRLEAQHPALSLWINFHNSDYEFPHYVDRVVHAAAHQNLLKFQQALSSKNNQRNLSENLPPWAAISAFRMIFKNTTASDCAPLVISELTAFARMLANAGNSTERRRYASFIDHLTASPDLAPVRNYIEENLNLTTPFNLRSELAMAKYFPLGVYVSTLTERVATEDELASLRAEWPSKVQDNYKTNISLGTSDLESALTAWQAERPQENISLFNTCGHGTSS